MLSRISESTLRNPIWATGDNSSVDCPVNRELHLQTELLLNHPNASTATNTAAGRQDYINMTFRKDSLHNIPSIHSDHVVDLTITRTNLIRENRRKQEVIKKSLCSDSLLSLGLGSYYVMVAHVIEHVYLFPAHTFELAPYSVLYKMLPSRFPLGVV